MELATREGVRASSGQSGKQRDTSRGSARDVPSGEDRRSRPTQGYGPTAAHNAAGSRGVLINEFNT